LVKSLRKTSEQSQQARVKKKKRNEATKKAFKEATSSLYANERTKPRSDETKVGARDICVP